MSQTIRRPDMTMETFAMPVLTPTDRKNNFQEVALGYEEELAVKEANRCMNCPAKYCKISCPLQNDIPQMMEHVRQRDYERAYECIDSTSPMPEICSRVCAQERQCQKNCTRAIKGEAVSIGAVERFVADWAQEHCKKSKAAAAAVAAMEGIEPEQEKASMKETKSAQKKVAIVGAGPAGASCAYSLAKKGYGVTVFEREPYVGGVPYYGIPSFVLPKEWSRNLAAKLEGAGVEIRASAPIGDVQELFAQGFDAAFVATGAGKAVRMGIEGEDLPGACQAGDYLKAVNVSQPINAKRVIVVGGGDTAVDAARCAIRLGAEEVTILYRRTEKDMPAGRRNVEHALEEGVRLVTLANPTRILRSGENALSVECARMQVGEEEYPGGRSRVHPVDVTDGAGQGAFTKEADLVIFALGYEAEAIHGIPTDGKGRILVAHDRVTSKAERVFAGGDAVTGAGTVAGAAAAGMRAADRIHGLLSGA